MTSGESEIDLQSSDIARFYEEQKTLENVKAALEAAGASLGDLVRTNTYVTDIDEYFKHTDVRMEYYNHAMPTSTTVEVRRLAGAFQRQRDTPQILRRGHADAPTAAPGCSGRLCRGSTCRAP